MTVTVKFSRRAAVAGSLAAATLATAGASGAVSGALADGAGDDGVSGDPGRVGGVDPTDEDALAEATGKDVSALDSARSVVVPAPSFGSFMTSGGDRVPVPVESPSEGAADGVMVWWRLSLIRRVLILVSWVRRKIMLPAMVLMMVLRVA